MPQSPVMTVLPVLVRVVWAIAPKDSARPITTAEARLARVGWVRVGLMRNVVVSARRERAHGVKLGRPMFLWLRGSEIGCRDR